MIKLLGIPFDANSSFLRGPAKGPEVIRQMHKQGASNPSSEFGSVLDFSGKIHDVGDLYFDSEDPQSAFGTIVNQVSLLIADGAKLITLGGDHSITYPIIQAFSGRYNSLHILHFDAHSDLYHSFDNNFYSHASPFARIMEEKLVASLIQVGLRTLCTHQRHQVAKYSIKTIEMKDFQTGFINDLEGPLYLSIDLDVLDPAFAPGVSHHEPGGLSSRELLTCLQKITVPIVGADIVEYNPDRDINLQTAMVAYKVLKEVCAIM